MLMASAATSAGRGSSHPPTVFPSCTRTDNAYTPVVTARFASYMKVRFGQVSVFHDFCERFEQWKNDGTRHKNLLAGERRRIAERIRSAC
jgi:hypothetical protein